MRTRYSAVWLYCTLCGAALVAACGSSDSGSPAVTGMGGTAGAGLAGDSATSGGATHTGGSTATGGVTGTGGVTSSGGTPAIGGTVTTGGGTSTGGFDATGGVPATGGDTSSGGSEATGGETSTGGTEGQQPFKGVANSPAADLAALNAAWCYNWGTRPQDTDCHDPLFVPMVWGAGDVAGAIAQIANEGYDTVLGFNEPNKADQANMTVAEAIALWPDMTSNPALRVGSPAVSDDGRAWLEDFMAQVQANGLRVDFIAMHWYGWNAGSCVASQLEGAINWAEQWGLPVWITEWGCMGSSNPDEQTVLDFFQDAVPMIERHPLVERYAWYPWNTYNHLTEDGVLTGLGQAFADAPAYR